MLPVNDLGKYGSIGIILGGVAIVYYGIRTFGGVAQTFLAYIESSEKRRMEADIRHERMTTQLTGAIDRMSKNLDENTEYLHKRNGTLDTELHTVSDRITTSAAQQAITNELLKQHASSHLHQLLEEKKRADE